MADNNIKTNLEWVSTLSVDRTANQIQIRKTSIICTIGTLSTLSLDISVVRLINYFDIGPNTNSVEMITRLRNAGMNIVRMNFSHGSYDV